MQFKLHFHEINTKPLNNFHFIWLKLKTICICNSLLKQKALEFGIRLLFKGAHSSWISFMAEYQNTGVVCPSVSRRVCVRIYLRHDFP